MTNPPRKQQKITNLRRQGTLNPRPQAVTNGLFRSGEFFDAHDLLQVKYEMLRSVEVEGETISESAASFGFSRPSFYEAQAAFAKGGLHGLLPQKRGPQRAHKLNTQVMTFLEELRQQQPTLSSTQLAEGLFEEFQLRVHPRSIERALARHQKKLR
jgi:transposase